MCVLGPVLLLATVVFLDIKMTVVDSAGYLSFTFSSLVESGFVRAALFTGRNLCSAVYLLVSEPKSELQESTWTVDRQP